MRNKEQLKKIVGKKNVSDAKEDLAKILARLQSGPLGNA